MALVLLSVGPQNLYLACQTREDHDLLPTHHDHTYPQSIHAHYRRGVAIQSICPKEEKKRAHHLTFQVSELLQKQTGRPHLHVQLKFTTFCFGLISYQTIVCVVHTMYAINALLEP